VTILVLGAYGLLGTTLCSYLDKKKYNIIKQSREKFADCSFNPVEEYQMLDFIKRFKPCTVINLIAQTDVDKCEKFPNLAFEANVKVVQNLVNAHKKYPFHLIHISTDQLYEGEGPHSENSINPINVYSLTKFCAEILCQQINSTILRTNFVGKSKSNKKLSFTDWLYKMFKSKNQINLFNDVIFNPIDIKTLCFVIEQCLLKDYRGTFNIGSRSFLTKEQFGLKMAEGLNIDINERFNSVSYKTLNLYAKRPLNMSMDVSNWEKTTKSKLPTIKQVLEDIINEYKIS